MPTILLDDRALVTVDGTDAESFLQAIVTCDLSAIGTSEIAPGALLTPQGKIQFDFLVTRDGPNGLIFDCRRDIASDLARRLTLYRLRAKAEISVSDHALVAVRFDTDSACSEVESGWLRDTRFKAPVWRQHRSERLQDGDRSAWDRFRITHGVAESGSDYALGDAFPHDVLLDQNGGVGFRKGCYVGQEVVSRMHHRGTARRRILIATGDAALPPFETPVEAGGRPIGTMGSSVGTDGLALVRIDKVKDAMDAGEPISVGGVTLHLAIPPDVRFTFPEAATGEA